MTRSNLDAELVLEALGRHLGPQIDPIEAAAMAGAPRRPRRRHAREPSTRIRPPGRGKVTHCEFANRLRQADGAEGPA